MKTFPRFSAYFTSGLLARESYILRGGEVVPAVDFGRQFEIACKGKVYRVTVDRRGEIGGPVAPDDRELCEVIEAAAALVATGEPLAEGGQR
jgi:hypothetical protein